MSGVKTKFKNKAIKSDTKSFDFVSLFGGDKRDRTADLYTASVALSQLSYTPIWQRPTTWNDY